MPLGAAYFNCYYPGPIGLPPNSLFEVTLDGRHVMLYLVRHLRPVVVTDFGNDFTHIQRGEGRRHLALKREIPTLDPDLISVDARLTDGTIETIAGYGKEHNYRLYRRASFSEFTAGVEFNSPDDPSVNGSLLLRAIERLILLYRVASRDVRVTLPERLKSDVPVIREAQVLYSATDTKSGPQERLYDHLPSSFQPTIFSLKEYERYLPVFQHDERDVAARVGHHLAAGTEISEAQRALVDSFDLLVGGGSPRFTLVEALSICEIMVFELLATTRLIDSALDDRLRRLERKQRPTLAKALGFLPDLLTDYAPDLPEILADLHRSANRRNKTLHERAAVSVDEATTALNSAQRLLFAIERHGKAASDRDQEFTSEAPPENREDRE